MSDDLRDRLAAALRPAMLLGLQDAELYDEPGRERINQWVDWIGDTLAPLVQAELDREAEVSQRLMRQRKQLAEERFAWQERGDRAEAALARVREFCHAVRASGDIKSHPLAQDILRLLDQPVLVPLASSADAEQVPCSFAVLARTHEGALMPHAPHSWQPQPGMTPVWCPGPAGAGSAQDGAQ